LPVGGLAFDIDRQTLVLFGGYGPGGQSSGAYSVLNETWEWTAPTGWKLLHPKTVPSARGMTAMGYDEARHLVLMYGGRDSADGSLPCGEVARSLCSTDTWTWNGSDWTQLIPKGGPPPFVPTIAYDVANAGVLLYNINGNIPETWHWDGVRWTLKVSGSTNPQPNRETPVMASDPATGRVIMFGGFSQGGDTSTMWSWTGQSWTSLGVQAPFRRLTAIGAGDRDRRVLIGYQGPEDVNTPSKTWIWDGVRWTQLHPMRTPSVWQAGLFADPKHHRVLLVGTNFTNGNAIEIWVWNGDDWSQLG
jgi:hypothetical protein